MADLCKCVCLIRIDARNQAEGLEHDSAEWNRVPDTVHCVPDKIRRCINL